MRWRSGATCSVPEAGGTRDGFRQEPVTGNPSDGRCISEFGSTHKHKAQRRFFISHRSITTKSLGVGTSLKLLLRSLLGVVRLPYAWARADKVAMLSHHPHDRGVFIIVYGGSQQRDRSSMSLCPLSSFSLRPLRSHAHDFYISMHAKKIVHSLQQLCIVTIACVINIVPGKLPVALAVALASAPSFRLFLTTGDLISKSCQFQRPFWSPRVRLTTHLNTVCVKAHPRTPNRVRIFHLLSGKLIAMCRPDHPLICSPYMAADDTVFLPLPFELLSLLATHSTR
jgi:hypothetical protein